MGAQLRRDPGAGEPGARRRDPDTGVVEQLSGAAVSITAVASILITLALAFYSLGVWAERFSRYLKSRHVAAFWTGFFFDTTGTLAMELIRPGFDWTSAHTITGQIALWLMLAHAIWATRVVLRGDDGARRRFHRWSLGVWLIWLVPYIGGMFLGMAG